MTTTAMYPRLSLPLAVLLLATGMPNRVRAQSPAPDQRSGATPESLKTIGVVSGTAGLMFLAGAAAYHSGASSDQRAVADMLEAGLPLNDDVRERSDERKQTAIVLGVVGTTAVLGGALAYYLGHRASSSSGQELRVRPVVQSSARRDSYTGLSLSVGF